LRRNPRYLSVLSPQEMESKEEIKRFNPLDLKECRAGIVHLREEGFVVWAALPSGEVKLLVELFNDWAETVIPSYHRGQKISEETVKLWGDVSGVLSDRGIGQSQFLWACRNQPAIRAVYSEFYGTQELATSFDGCNAYLGTQFEKQMNLHVDQSMLLLGNPEACVQSVVNLMDVDKKKGGSFVVVPKSRKEIVKMFLAGDEALRNYKFTYGPHKDTIGHKIGRLDQDYWTPKTIYLELKAGEIVSFFSTTVHTNRLIPSPEPELVRLAVYVSLSPFNLHSLPENKGSIEHPLSVFSKEEYIAERRKQAALGATTSHWASLLPVTKNSSSVIPECCKKTQFSPEEEALLTGSAPV
jgi:ectoine hydroxylase-related dioxygenase (phytanoyl-CoA dioxygenase family)